jgi:PAS domain-containing protein
VNTKANMLERFSITLRSGLVNKFSRMPTAQKFSDEFNLRSVKPITRETARKWINGLVMPESERLLVLIQWLSLNSDYVYLNSTEVDVENYPPSKIQRLRQREAFTRNALNFASPRIAIMDKDGTIILVNEAWRAAANLNPPLHKTTTLCEGANYLEILDKVKGLEKENAKETASAIRDLAKNPGKNFVFKYPCHAPSEKHWFIAELSSFHEKENQCLTISHQEISERQFLAKI